LSPCLSGVSASALPLSFRSASPATKSAGEF
jgi:hypothetical protein